MISTKINEKGARNVLEALSVSVEDTSDDEIVEEFRQNGQDAKAEANSLQQDLVAFITNHQRQTLREQHSKSHRQLTHAEYQLPRTVTAAMVSRRPACG